MLCPLLPGTSTLAASVSREYCLKDELVLPGPPPAGTLTIAAFILHELPELRLECECECVVLALLLLSSSTPAIAWTCEVCDEFECMRKSARFCGRCLCQLFGS